MSTLPKGSHLRQRWEIVGSLAVPACASLDHVVEDIDVAFASAVGEFDANSTLLLDKATKLASFHAAFAVNSSRSNKWQQLLMVQNVGKLHLYPKCN